MNQNRSRLRLHPDSTGGGAYSALPDPLAGFKEPTSKSPISKRRDGREGEEK